MLADSGKRIVIHTVITGGQAMRDTLAGLAVLMEQMPGDARDASQLRSVASNAT